MVKVPRSMTAEDFVQHSTPGKLTELVRGEIVDLGQPDPRHGQICSNINFLLRQYLEKQPVGFVVSNSVGIRTSLDPDTVRACDVWLISRKKIPEGRLPRHYLNEVPDLAFEVISPTDRWSQILAKVAEYLEIGISSVSVFDPEAEMIRVYYSDKPELIFAGTDPVIYPEQLPGFDVQAHRFFE